MKILNDVYSNTSNRNLMTYVGAKSAEKLDNSFKNATPEQKHKILV